MFFFLQYSKFLSRNMMTIRQRINDGYKSRYIVFILYASTMRRFEIAYVSNSWRRCTPNIQILCVFSWNGVYYGVAHKMVDDRVGHDC